MTVEFGADEDLRGVALDSQGRTVLAGLTSNGPTGAVARLAVPAAVPPNNAAPTLSPDPLPGRTLSVGETATVTFTVADDLTPPGSLVVTATSSNTSVVPQVTIGVNGPTRMLTFTPTAAGNSQVTVIVSDGVNEVVRTFTVTAVSPVNNAPTINPDTLPATSATVGKSTTVSFAIADTETAVSGLTVTVTSSNKQVVADIAIAAADAKQTLTLTPLSVGTTEISVSVSDGTNTTVRTFTFTGTSVGSATFPPGSIVVGGRFDGSARIFVPSGERYVPSPSPSFFGQSVAVRTAVGDVNGDGTVDFIGGTGPGTATRVVVIDGATQQTLTSFEPFEAAFTGGIFLAVGDFDGDNRADIVVTPDQGGGPRATIYSGNGFGKIADFFAIDDPNFRGGRDRQPAT